MTFPEPSLFMLVLGRVCDAIMRRLKVVPVVLDLVRYYISYCTCFALLKTVTCKYKAPSWKSCLRHFVSLRVQVSICSNSIIRWCFLRLTLVACFPALGSGCMFSRARLRLHVFPRLALVARTGLFERWITPPDKSLSSGWRGLFC